jgi:hypothetical protein
VELQTVCIEHMDSAYDNSHGTVVTVHLLHNLYKLCNPTNTVLLNAVLCGSMPMPAALVGATGNLMCLLPCWLLLLLQKCCVV